MKANRRSLLLLSTLFCSTAISQSNIYEFKYLNEKYENKNHKSKGNYAISIRPAEATIYWDQSDLSERADFDLINQRDTVINKRSYIMFTGKSQAFKDYYIDIFYPVSNNIKELHIIDKEVNTHYIFN